MLAERRVPEEWVRACVASPDLAEPGDDGNMHYYRAIAERDGRVLHVVINPHVAPRRIVTLFFDRRARRKL